MHDCAYYLFILYNSFYYLILKLETSKGYSRRRRPPTEVPSIASVISIMNQSTDSQENQPKDLVTEAHNKLLTATQKAYGSVGFEAISKIQALAQYLAQSETTYPSKTEYQFFVKWLSRVVLYSWYARTLAMCEHTPAELEKFRGTQDPTKDAPAAVVSSLAPLSVCEMAIKKILHDAHPWYRLVHARGYGVLAVLAHANASL